MRPTLFPDRGQRNQSADTAKQESGRRLSEHDTRKESAPWGCRSPNMKITMDRPPNSNTAVPTSSERNNRHGICQASWPFVIAESWLRGSAATHRKAPALVRPCAKAWQLNFARASWRDAALAEETANNLRHSKSGLDSWFGSSDRLPAAIWLPFGLPASPLDQRLP